MTKVTEQEHRAISRPRSYTYILPRTPKPQLPPRPHTRPSRPKGLPVLGEKFDQNFTPEEFDPDNPATTPYRLPKIRDESSPQEDELYKVWSRHGYDVYTTKPVELQVLANQMDTTPRILSQEIRKSQIAANFPKFKEAIISPSQIRSKAFPPNNASFHQGIATRPTTVNTEDTSRLPFVHGEGHSGSPVEQPTRCSSPAKSARSIHWALTPYRNTNQDIQGRSRKQGPYSRQFTVHCSAPNNWLKQKYFRSKTLPV